MVASIECQELIKFEIFPIASVFTFSIFVAITLRIDVTFILVDIIFICILVITFLLLSSSGIVTKGGEMGRAWGFIYLFSVQFIQLLYNHEDDKGGETDRGGKKSHFLAVCHPCCAEGCLG